MAATLSGGEAGAILLIVIVRVLATGGQVLAQALLSCADNWLEADSARSHLEHSSQVEVEWQPCCQARPLRSCSKLSLSVRQQREERSSFHLCGAAQLCPEDGPPLCGLSWAGLARRRARQHFAGASNRHDLVAASRASSAAAELSAVSSWFELALHRSALDFIGAKKELRAN